MSEISSLLPWLIVVLVLWACVHVGMQVIRHNGLVLLRLEAMEELLARGAGKVPSAQGATGRPEGLSPGTTAPELELRDVEGEERSLSDFSGRRLLLVFFDLRCGFCQKLLPELAALPIDAASASPLPIVLAHGDAADYRRLVEQHGLRCPVLLLEAPEGAAAYQAAGTPVGYLVDEGGTIQSHLAVGAPALMALARGDEESHRSEEVTGARLRSLSESRIERDGLGVGTVAPAFDLPRVGGGELSLEEYRGRRVLLVFSDPECGPCDHLAVRLEALHRETPDVQVLMISRRDEASNRTKIERHGLSFPVALQRSWEISRRYARFGTPLAYLIDESGVIAADVAVGPDAILALLSHGGTPSESLPGTGTALLWREPTRVDSGSRAV